MKHVTTMSRNCMTRALSITLILGLLLSSLAFSPNLSEIFSTNVWADTDGYWSDYTDTAWYYNNPDESTYKIGTAEELAGFAKLVNDGTDTFEGKTIKLTDDINLDGHDWVPIGLANIKDENENIKDVFKGNFDGQGRTISNMHIGTSEAPANYKYAGLFGYLEADSGETITIANVNIGENSWVYISADAKVKKAYGDSAAFAGGICAFAAVTAGTITISSCSNSGTITAKDNSAAYAGGICAKAYAKARSDAKADDDAYATATLIISNCSNSGTITAFAEEGYSFVYAGGICAKAYASAIRAYDDDDDELKAETILTINNCKNSGTIESNSARSVTTGGICADANTYAANTNVTAKITIINCSNSGTITAFAEEGYSYVYAGGICARACGIKLSSVTIINCSNSADISSSANNRYQYGMAYAGGICAGFAGTITISNCYYKQGTAATGIANEVDQAGEITALPESQMKATTGTKDVEDWVDITIDGDDKGKMALVDALNNYVDNNLSDGLLNWIQDDNVNDGYPTIKTNNNNAD